MQEAAQMKKNDDDEYECLSEKSNDDASDSNCPENDVDVVNIEADEDGEQGEILDHHATESYVEDSVAHQAPQQAVSKT